jgi:RNA polymerase sigma factor (sigma-70 family)
METTMSETPTLGARFEENRSRLQAVAYRMLGSKNEAEDAVQEAWLRLTRTDESSIENLAGFLTTLVARVCLDTLRARKLHAEEPIDDAVADAAGSTNPEHHLLLADAIAPALLIVLDTLPPSERVALVLHDMFGLSFEDISPIVGRTPLAARKLASRGRSRVQGARKDVTSAHAHKRALVDAFLRAARSGDFAALLAVLDPGASLRADETASKGGITTGISGAHAVATQFSGRASEARRATADGEPTLAWVPAGKLRVVFEFTISDGRIGAITLHGDASYIGEREIELLPD